MEGEHRGAEQIAKRGADNGARDRALGRAKRMEDTPW
jgi:hypothetical protein